MSEPNILGGLPVYRQISPWAHLPEYIYSANDPKITDEPGVWLALSRADAVEAVLQGARGVACVLADGSKPDATYDQLRDALEGLDRLDALAATTPTAGGS